MSLLVRLSKVLRVPRIPNKVKLPAPVRQQVRTHGTGTNVLTLTQSHHHRSIFPVISFFQQFVRPHAMGGIGKAVSIFGSRLSFPVSLMVRRAFSHPRFAVGLGVAAGAVLNCYSSKAFAKSEIDNCVTFIKQGSMDVRLTEAFQEEGKQTVYPNNTSCGSSIRCVRSAPEEIIVSKKAAALAERKLEVAQQKQQEELNKISEKLQLKEQELEKTVLALKALQSQVGNLNQKIELLNDDQLCNICMLNEKNIVYNCGHRSVCNSCDDILLQRNNHCPICRSAITTRIKHFPT